MAGITPPAIQTYQMKPSSYGLRLDQVGKQLFVKDEKLKQYCIKIEIRIVNNKTSLNFQRSDIKIYNT